MARLWNGPQNCIRIPRFSTSNNLVLGKSSGLKRRLGVIRDIVEANGFQSEKRESLILRMKKSTKCGFVYSIH